MPRNNVSFINSKPSPAPPRLKLSFNFEQHKRCFKLSILQAARSKLSVLNTVMALLLAVNYYHVGCYEDKSSRAIPKSLGVWRNDNKLIEKCAQAAKQAGYSAFAIQFKSECWSGPLAHMTYSIYGTSSGCLNGVGGTWAQDVYFFSKWCFVTSLPYACAFFPSSYKCFLQLAVVLTTVNTFYSG